MAMFFLHLCNGDGFVEDEEGREFNDLSAAQAEAVSLIRHVSADEVVEGKIFRFSFVEIEDHRHNHIATVRFSDAVDLSDAIERQPRPLG